jgi:hypothetical protein
VKATKRRDPVSRPPLGAAAGDEEWANKQPDRHYIEVDGKAQWHGVDFYLNRGYEVETVRVGGPRLKSSRTARAEGSECTRFGMVLMSCPLEEKLERDAEGQLNADANDRRMRKPDKAEGAISKGHTRVSYEDMSDGEESVRA